MRRLITAAVCSVLVACSTGGGPAPDATQTEPSASSTAAASPSDTPPAAAPALDLRGRVPPTRIGDGMSVASCEGDAPLLCVSRGDVTLGAVAYQSFPLDSLPDLQDLLVDMGPQDAVASNAETFLFGMEADRLEGCPDGYDFDADHPRPATVAGNAGVALGFSVESRGGHAVERNVAFHVLIDETLWVIQSEAQGEGSCLPPEGPTWQPAQLRAFEPTFRAMVANLTLPNE